MTQKKTNKVKKSIEQSVYDALFQASLDQGYDTYMDIAPENAKYPFVHLESMQRQYIPNKTDIKGFVSVSLSVYGLKTKRNQVTQMAQILFEEAFQLDKVNGYVVGLNPSASSLMVQMDRSTNTPLCRAIMYLEFTIF